MQLVPTKTGWWDVNKIEAIQLIFSIHEHVPTRARYHVCKATYCQQHDTYYNLYLASVQGIGTVLHIRLQLYTYWDLYTLGFRLLTLIRFTDY